MFSHKTMLKYLEDESVNEDSFAGFGGRIQPSVSIIYYALECRYVCKSLKFFSILKDDDFMRAHRARS